MTKPTAAVTAATSMASITWRQGLWMYLKGGRAVSSALPQQHPRLPEVRCSKPYRLQEMEGCARRGRAAESQAQ